MAKQEPQMTKERKEELLQVVNSAGRGQVIKVNTKEEANFVSVSRAACIARKAKEAQKSKVAPVSKESDGSSADYYKLPRRCTQLQDLIAARDMNAQMGEIFRATYRYGQCPHSPKEREIKKILFYAKAELDRLKKYELDKIDITNLGVEDL